MLFSGHPNRRAFAFDIDLDAVGQRTQIIQLRFDQVR